MLPVSMYEVLTDQGWLTYDNLKPNQRILSYNFENCLLEFDELKDSVFQKDVEIYTIGLGSDFFKTSLDHYYCVNNSFTSVDKFSINSTMLLTSKYYVSNNDLNENNDLNSARALGKSLSNPKSRKVKEDLIPSILSYSFDQIHSLLDSYFYNLEKQNIDYNQKGFKYPDVVQLAMYLQSSYTEVNIVFGNTIFKDKYKYLDSFNINLNKNKLFVVRYNKEFIMLSGTQDCVSIESEMENKN